MKVVNKTKVVRNVSLKTLISENFGNGKVFYSIEVTPKVELELNFNEFNTLPLFVDITWIRDENLKVPIIAAPAFELARKIKSSAVVNTLTCYRLTDDHLNEVLNDSETIKNLTVVRGGQSLGPIMKRFKCQISDVVDEYQKFKFANELIKEIRAKAGETITVFGAGHPEAHIESLSADSDLQNLKKKVKCGVDVVLTQVIFSADKFVDFVRRCRRIGISSEVVIIPGLYIPFDMSELDFVLRLTKASMDSEVYDRLANLKNDPEEFKRLSLSITIKMIEDVRVKSPESIRGFHFFTMNHFEMIQSLIRVVDFSEG